MTISIALRATQLNAIGITLHLIGFPDGTDRRNWNYWAANLFSVIYRLIFIRLFKLLFYAPSSRQKDSRSQGNDY